MHLFRIIIFYFILLFGQEIFANERADFLIIENPAPLKIYDRYQQELSPAEKSRQIAFAPLRIINENELLGDQITASVHVRLGSRHEYFIIKNNKDQILNRKEAGKIETLKNCVIINDSIYVKKDNALTLKTFSSPVPLAAGSRIIRIFKYKNRYYVRQTEPQKQYGWLNLKDKALWSVIKQNETLQTDRSYLNAQLHSDILEIFKKANRLYERYFDFFNREALKHEPPPRWEIQFDADSIHAVFHPDSLLNEFKESVNFTRRQLENILIGAPFRITMQNNHLIIRRGGGK